MESELAALLVAVGLTACSILLLMAGDWRISIGLLAAQYVGVFVLVALDWPLVMAVTRLVAGWMAAAVLGMAMVGLPQADRRITDAEIRPTPGPLMSGRRRPFRLYRGEAPGPVFTLLAALLIILTIAVFTPLAMNWLPGLTAVHAWGGLILIGLGLLKLGFHAQPLHVILGLLTLLAGFEILFDRLTAAPLTAALTAALTLATALAGAYLLLAPHMEPGE